MSSFKELAATERRLGQALETIAELRSANASLLADNAAKDEALEEAAAYLREALSAENIRRAADYMRAALRSIEARKP